MKREPIRLLDYFFVLRPLLLVPVWAFVIFGYNAGQADHLGVTLLSNIRVLPYENNFTILLFLYGLLFGGIYILNQLADYETDKRSPVIWLIASGKFPKLTAAVEMIILFIVSLTASFVFFPASLIFFFTLLLGIIYCIPPTRFSGRPVFDFLTNALAYGGAAFALGWTFAGGELDVNLVKSAAPYFLLMAAGSLNSTITDRKDDEATGKITSAVLWGERRTIIISTIFLIASINLALIFHDIVCLSAGLISFPFFIRAVVKGRREDYLRTYHIAGPAIMVIAGIIYPLLFALILPIYLLSRWYYPARMGVNYPKAGR
ncbi:UbiA family prenyltransferase [bacterium]|nr:UbiA family prenyltransferase [FCB group bacterium]MBL7191791.1 UbiA family prenyltransferase [bacterium]